MYDSVNCVSLNELMQKKYRWTLTVIQYPLGSHLAVTDANADYCREFAANLADCIRELKEHPKENKSGNVAIYGFAD